jgi:hypothetical protein
MEFVTFLEGLIALLATSLTGVVGYAVQRFLSRVDAVEQEVKEIGKTIVRLVVTLEKMT